MNNASNLVELVWPSCRRVSATVSDGLDRRLSTAEHVSVGLHAAFCPGCRAFRRQVRAIHELFRRLRSRADARDKLPRAFLPEEARGRIRAALEERARDGG
jgi:hypothetical protein